MSETFHQRRQPSLLSANSDDFNPRNNDDVPSHSSSLEANPSDNNRCQDNVNSSSSSSPNSNTEGNTTPDEESSLLKMLLSSTSSDDFNPRNNDDDVPSHSSLEAKTPDNNRRQDSVDSTSSSSPNIITEGNTTHDGSVESSLQKLLPSLMITHADVINPQDNVDSSPSSEGKPLITRRQRQPAPNSQGDPDNYNNVSTSGESTLPIAIITHSSPLLLPTAPHQPPETFFGKSLNILTSSLNPLPLLSRARSCSALPAGGFARARASPPPPPPPGGVEQEVVDNRWKLTMDNMLGLMGILAGFAIASIFSIPGGSVNTPDQVAGVGTASLLPYGYGIQVIYGLSGSTVVIILFLLLCFLGGLGGPRFSRIALLLLAEAIVSEVASLATHMLINLDCMHGQTPMWLGVVFLCVAIFVFIIFI